MKIKIFITFILACLFSPLYAEITEQYRDKCHFTLQDNGALLLDNQQAEISGGLLPYHLGWAGQWNDKIGKILHKNTPCIVLVGGQMGNKYHRPLVKLTANIYEELLSNGLMILHNNDEIWLWNIERNARNSKLGIWGRQSPLYRFTEGKIDNWAEMNNLKYLLHLQLPNNTYSDIITPKKYMNAQPIKKHEWAGANIMVRGFAPADSLLTITHPANIIINKPTQGEDDE